MKQVKAWDYKKRRNNNNVKTNVTPVIIGATGTISENT
jgi:hypothetical protein